MGKMQSFCERSSNNCLIEITLQLVMSRTKNRVIFSHQQDGRDRQLFFVTEKADDSLLVIINAEDNLGTPSSAQDIFVKDPEYRPLTTNRISIHNSDKSSGMLVKQTNEISMKQAETHACFISSSKTRLFHPVFYRLYPDLSNQKYDVKKTPKASMMVGCSKRTDGACLCISVLVCNREEPLPLFPWNVLSTMDFKRYRIAVYHCFLNVIPNNLGVSSFEVTEKGGRGDGGVNSVKPEDLGAELLDRFELLAAARIEQHAAGVEPKMANALRSHRLYFHPTVDSLMFGRAQRRENIV